jgi:GNAT superfamily N-acetyltransferase
MSLLMRALTKVEKFRALVPGAVEVLPLDLERDWGEIEALMRAEEWPFLRGDLELGEAQTHGASFIARKDGKFAAFFTTFMFGHIGYLDMLIIRPEFRSQGVGRPLYFRAVEALQQMGASGLLCHSTNDSARLIKILGFTPGRSFTMYVREPGPSPDGPTLTAVDVARYQALDTEIFGTARTAWTHHLANDPDVDIVGYGSAVVALRPKVGGYTLDQFLAPDEADIAPIVDGIIAKHGNTNTLMVSCTTGGALESVLKARGFVVPDFFVPIGPLVEWREGQTDSVGRSALIQSVLWL